MSKIQRVTKTRMGGMVFATVEQAIAFINETVPQTDSIMSLETVGMIVHNTELIDDGKVLVETKVFDNQSVYDIWLDNFRTNRKDVWAGLGWTVEEPAVITTI